MKGFQIISSDEIFLCLDGEFCIETVTKKVRGSLLQEYLNLKTASPTMECALELLRQFLEEQDFGRLRAENPVLAGNVPCGVIIYRRTDGQVGWRLAPGE